MNAIELREQKGFVIRWGHLSLPLEGLSNFLVLLVLATLWELSSFGGAATARTLMNFSLFVILELFLLSTAFLLMLWGIVEKAKSRPGMLKDQLVSMSAMDPVYSLRNWCLLLCTVNLAHPLMADSLFLCRLFVWLGSIGFVFLLATQFILCYLTLKRFVSLFWK